MHFSTRFKTVLGIGLIELVALATLLFFGLNYIRQTNADALNIGAQSSADLFASMAQNSVLSYDLADLESSVNKLMTNEAVLFARVLDANGRVLAEKSIPDTELLGSTLMVGTDIQIETEVYGRVELGFSTALIDDIVADAKVWGATIALLELIAVALFSLLLSYFLTRQLNILSNAAKRIADGDLKSPIQVESKDEVGQLGYSLELMRLELERSRSEITSTNAALAEKVEALESALKREKKLFSVVGHELRTPLSIVKMLLDRPKEQIDPLHLLGNIEHTLDLVDDMSVLAGVEAKHELHPVDLNQFMPALIDDLHAFTEPCGMTLKLTQNSAQACFVELPTKALRQVVSNLVRNAALHSKGQNIDVIVSQQPITPECFEISFHIIDDGCGIPEADHERLFNAFERGNTVSDGTGLGLSVCKELAHRLGGSLNIMPEKNEPGCDFHLQFNAKKYTPNSSKLSLQQDNNSLAGKRVLVAEDNPTIQLLTRELLEAKQCEVICADNGKQALDLALSDPDFDLLITDFMMPVIDGVGLIRALRENGYNLPIIGVTAATVGMEMQQMLEAGANAVLSKPLDIRAVIEQVQFIESEK